MAFAKVITRFVRNMMPSFDRVNIENELTRLFKQMEKMALPASEVSYGAIQGSATYKRLETAVARKAKRYAGNVPLHLNKIIVSHLEDKDDLFDLVANVFSTKIEREGIEYKHAHLLHLISSIEFFNDYLIKFFLVTTKEVMGNKHFVMDKDEAKFVNDAGRINSFAIVCRALEHKFKDFDKLFSKVEGITFDPSTAEMVESMHGKATDPLGSGFISVDYNPFYLGGKVYNALYVHLHDQKKEEIAKLNAHISYLTAKRLDESDTVELERLNKIIAYHDNRLNKLAAQVEEELEHANS